MSQRNWIIVIYRYKFTLTNRKGSPYASRTNNNLKSQRMRWQGIWENSMRIWEWLKIEYSNLVPIKTEKSQLHHHSDQGSSTNSLFNLSLKYHQCLQPLKQLLLDHKSWHISNHLHHQSNLSRNLIITQNDHKL